MSTPPNPVITLRIVFDSGHAEEIAVTAWSLKKNSVSGELQQLSTTTPPTASAPVYINLSKVVFLSSREENQE